MKQEELRADAAFRRRTGHYDKPAIAAKNQLEQNFDVEAPDQTRVTDITYIRIHEDWLYLAAAPDPFSRQVIGRSTHPRVDSQLMINALRWLFGGKILRFQHCPFQSGISIKQP